MKIRMTIETSRVVVVRRNRAEARMWCQECRAQAQVVSLEQAALLVNASVRHVCRQVDAGLFHFTETPDGRLFICLDSLLAGWNREASAAPPGLLLSNSEGEPNS